MKLENKTYVGDYPDWESLSPDLQWKERKALDLRYEKKRRQVVKSWIVTGVICLIPATYIAYKPLNDAVGIVASTLNTIGWISSIFAPPSTTPVNTASTGVWENANVKAFADTLAWAEGTGDTYDVTYGYHKFDMSLGHPDTVYCDSDKTLCSAVAGRWQYMPDRWKAHADKLGLTDMSPESQDKVLVDDLKDLGVYDRIKSGDKEDIKKVFCELGNVWASLPCNTYGQPQKDVDALLKVYDEKLAASNSGDATNTASAVNVGSSWNIAMSDSNITTLLVNTLSKPFGINTASGSASTNTTSNTSAGNAVNTGDVGQYLLMVDSGDTFEGMKLYNLNLVSNGVIQSTIQVVSGSPGSEPLRSDAQSRDNYKPIPDGEYDLDTPESIPYDNAMGSMWIGIHAKINTVTGGRDGFGFHVDANRDRNSAGTAGCIAPKNNKDIDTIALWVNNGATKLKVSLFATQKDIILPQNNIQNDTTAHTSPVTASLPIVNTVVTNNNKFKIQLEYGADIADGNKKALEEAKSILEQMIGSDRSITYTVIAVNLPTVTWLAFSKPDLDTLDKTGLPTNATIQINTAKPFNKYVYLHEMIHGLGFTNLLPNFNNAIDGNVIKPNTIAGSIYGKAILLSADKSHWDESIGGKLKSNEIMTPYAPANLDDMYVGKITLGMLRDIGYKINPDYEKMAILEK